MASYGRNFDFRIPPDGPERKGRFYLTAAGGTITIPNGTGVPIGAPIIRDAGNAAPSQFPGASDVTLAHGAQPPKQGLSGILVYEHAPAAFAGYDEGLTTYSDLGYAPTGKLVQMVSGVDVKVVFTNTAATTFLQTTSYPARKMVTGIGIATPTLAIGDYLTPGTGTDAGGYWDETASATNAWLVVVAVDNARGEVEAQFLF